MLLILILIQSASEVPGWASLGVGGALAALIFYYYRVDRKTSDERYAADRKASEDRYVGLSADFRSIVQENTRAVTSLTQTLEHAKDRD